MDTDSGVVTGVGGRGGEGTYPSIIPSKRKKNHKGISYDNITNATMVVITAIYTGLCA